MTDIDFVSINRTAWDSRTDIHVTSDFYDVSGFLNGKNVLTKIDRDFMPDVAGKSLVHLQCHFGLDTLCWKKLGAEVTGLDLSPKSIAKARELSEQTKLEANFVEGNVLAASDLLKKQFDIVYTSWGALCWLPDMDAWAAEVRKLLKPGGELNLVEFHPVVYMYEEGKGGIVYDYFNVETIDETESGSYTDGGEAQSIRSITWNHPMSEIVGALLKQGLIIQKLEEYDYSPYPCFEELREDKPGEYIFKKVGRKLPYAFALKAILPV